MKIFKVICILGTVAFLFLTLSLMTLEGMPLVGTTIVAAFVCGFGIVVVGFMERVQKEMENQSKLLDRIAWAVEHPREKS